MLYLVNAENIYFPKTKEYFREIISSYDNGNYRSAMVMLYSTIVCDLMLKLRELRDEFNDEKAKKMLDDINEDRDKAGDCTWERKLVERIWKETELLSDESYAMVKRIHELRNFSAHPALNEDYELISPTPEMTVAYVKKALDDIFTKPSIFAQRIVGRMSDDLASKKERFLADQEAFETYLERVYFCRMSSKMVKDVFKAFWKFTFVRTNDDGDVFQNNRTINRKLLEIMLKKYSFELCEFIGKNKTVFTVAETRYNEGHLCRLLAFYPQVYVQLDDTVKDQIKACNDDTFNAIKWFESGDIDVHLRQMRISGDVIPDKALKLLAKICSKQGRDKSFVKFLIDFYSNSRTYSSTRNRFDCMVEPYLDKFDKEYFIRIIEAINSNDQIYNYCGQISRNDRILESAHNLLGEEYDLSSYENFNYTVSEETDVAEPADSNDQEEF
jgi:hypothetical protein